MTGINESKPDEVTAKEGGEIAENSLRAGVDDVARGVEGAEGSSQKLLTSDRTGQLLIENQSTINSWFKSDGTINYPPNNARYEICRLIDTYKNESYLEPGK